MPLYDYKCPNCGMFDDFRSASRAAAPADCPECGSESPRVIHVPRIVEMSAALRCAHASNERSTHAPKYSTQEERAHRHEHGPGCSCCGGSEIGKSSALYRADGSKMFPSKRPWMISH